MAVEDHGITMHDHGTNMDDDGISMVLPRYAMERCTVNIP